MSCSQSQGKHKDVTNTPFIKNFHLLTPISILISQICLFGGQLIATCYSKGKHTDELKVEKRENANASPNGKHAARFPFWRERGTICAADGGKQNAVCQSEGKRAVVFRLKYDCLAYLSQALEQTGPPVIENSYEFPIVRNCGQ